MEPVADNPKLTTWVHRLEVVKARPGTWMRIYESRKVVNAYGQRDKLKNGTYKIPDGVWEFKSGEFKSGGAVWARFLGDENDS